jgi:type VI secretion system secreted protein Hcp
MSTTAAYLKLTTQKLGDIKGTARQKGREGMILVLAVNHEVASLIDIATNNPRGKRQHLPMVITKEVDKSTPILNQIMVENIPITEAILSFYGTDPVSTFPGMETNTYSIILRNVTITRIDLTLHNLLEDQKRNANLIERVSFIYKQIEWKWANGNISAIDNWEPVS